MIRRFVGWVPTITGNLSFSTLGFGRSPRKAFKTYRSFAEVRYAVAAQRRNKSDTLFSPIIDPLRGKRSTHVFLLVASCAGHSGFKSLDGLIYILSTELFSRIQGQLNEIDRAPTERDARDWITRLRTRIEQDIPTLQEIIDGRTDRHCSVVGVTLLRDGKALISVDEDRYLNSEIDVIASQAFFFLRDICHSHQHHSKNSDTIVDVYPSSPGEVVWKRETLYALYRWIIHRKREKSRLTYIRSRGVLAYLSAFEALHVADSRSDDILVQKGVPRYLIKEVENSLVAGEAEAAVHADSKQFLKSAFFSFLLTVAVAVLALSAFIQDFSLSERADGLQVSAQFVQFRTLVLAAAMYPFNSVLLLVGCFFILFVFFFARDILKSNGVLLDVVRLVFAPSYRASVVTLGLAFVGLVLTAFSLLLVTFG